MVRSERIADGVMHGLGVLSAFVGATASIAWAAGHADAGQIWALSIYGAALLATFSASAFYHLPPWKGI